MMIKPFKTLLLLSIFGCIIGFILLGNWQVERLAWKLGLIETVEARAFQTPIAAPNKTEWPQVNAADYEYLHVTLSGEFLHQYESQVYTVSIHGPGYWVLTPFKTNTGEVIYINRGFVPMAQKHPANRIHSPPQKHLDLHGLLRLPNADDFQMRSNLPQQNLWYNHDIKAMATYYTLNNVAPYYIDLDKTENTNSNPIAGLTKLEFRNTHLSYALTWYGMALLLAGLVGYVIYLKYKKIEPIEQ